MFGVSGSFVFLDDTRNQTHLFHERSYRFSSYNPTFLTQLRRYFRTAIATFKAFKMITNTYLQMLTSFSTLTRFSYEPLVITASGNPHNTAQLLNSVLKA